MGAGAATLWAVALAATADPPDWQYYCFRGASIFASADPTSRFSVLPSSAQVLGHGASEAPAAGRLLRVGAVESPAGAGSVVPDASRPVLAPPEAFVDVAARIAPLTGSCFFQRGGYWTYEVCPGLRVRQYHSENALSGAAKVRTEFSLGVYDPAGDEYVAAKGIFSQRFKAGSAGRATKVQFICGSGGSAAAEDGIVSVTEPAEKKYLIALRTAVMCGAKGGGEAEDAGAGAVAGGAAAVGEGAGAAAAAAGAAAVAGAGGPATIGGGDTGGEGVQVAELRLSPLGLLEKLHQRCFTVTSGYWTYEVCPGMTARQFRLEGKATTTEISLGAYDEAGDRISLGTPDGTAAGQAGHVWYIQSFTNGAGGRSADLRARCSPRNEHAIVAVSEPSPHHYILDLSTPYACEINCVRALPAAHRQQAAAPE